MSSPDPDVSGRPTPMCGWSYHFYYYYIICAWAHLTQTFLAGPHRCVGDPIIFIIITLFVHEPTWPRRFWPAHTDVWVILSFLLLLHYLCMGSPDPDVSGRPTPMCGWSYHFYYYYIICAWAHLTQTFLAGPHRCVGDPIIFIIITLFVHGLTWPRRFWPAHTDVWVILSFLLLLHYLCMSPPDPDVSGRPTPMYGWSYHFYYYYIICAWAHLTQTFLAGPHRCVDDPIIFIITTLFVHELTWPRRFWPAHTDVWMILSFLLLLH